jgi:DNA-binding NtrC family response regulator
VVVLTAYGTVTTAVDAMKEGASDFLEKPVELDDLSQIVRSLLRGEETGSVTEVPGAPPIVGRHPRMKAALRLLTKVAPTASTVLLTGETGTGKELFARALHALSPRAAGAFVAVNCAAIPEALMENELFGHERGAFTGAAQLQRGRFELAAGGTIFLDEIGELDLAVQGKILRVLEERTYERVGGGRPMAADVRVVAATNRDLSEMADRGEFRRDLLYRVDVFPIELPALRDRPSDVATLSRFLLARIGARLGAPVPELADDALAFLESQPWPGNVRQLSNVLERAAILDERGAIRAADLESLVRSAETGERDRLRQALIEAGGDKQRAAEILGISLRTVQRKVREHDLEGVPRYRD